MQLVARAPSSFEASLDQNGRLAKVGAPQNFKESIVHAFVQLNSIYGGQVGQQRVEGKQTKGNTKGKRSDNIDSEVSSNTIIQNTPIESHLREASRKKEKKKGGGGQPSYSAERKTKEMERQ